MASRSTIKPTQKTVRDYYAALEQYNAQGVKHEGALRTAFQTLLEVCGRSSSWTLIPELPFASGGRSVRPDGTFRDGYWIRRGYWEAKDTDDDLEKEIQKKIKLGYPLTNMIFEDTRRAHLFQNGELAVNADLSQPSELTGLLNAFFAYREPAHEQFDQAVTEFSDRVPELAVGLVEIISKAHQDSKRFISAFGQFHELCRTSINPNISQAAVDQMLVQHLLTERLMRCCAPDFLDTGVMVIKPRLPV